MTSSESFQTKQKESVAVIGGGIAGLNCARVLQESGKFVATVFDTGRLRPGGRCSSRFIHDASEEDQQQPQQHSFLRTCTVDHAAQILTVPSKDPGYEKFAQQVQQWCEEGILQPFSEHAVCEIEKDHRHEENPFHLKELDSSQMYYVTDGMGNLPLHLMKDLHVEQDVWVSPSNGVKYVPTKQHWVVKAKGQVLGTFDRLVIAHNGKCADRLMSKTPAKELHSLLRVNFGPTVPKNGGKRMTLNSIYSLTFALDKKDSALSRALPDSFVCGFVTNEPNLRFLSCNTRKYPKTATKSDDEVEVWTVLSSAKFAKTYKAPQENLPPDVVEEVTALLMKSLEKSLDLGRGSLRGSLDGPAIGGARIGGSHVLEARLQLWGAAVPLNTWRALDHHHDEYQDGFVYDATRKVGVCGDWLMDPSIPGAWESGRRLAQYMVTTHADGTEEDIGLPPDGAFRASKTAFRTGIGSV